MSARDIIGSLSSCRYRDSFAVPNYTPKNWWECDLFEVTKAGYFREYEVKISRGDFFADAKKEREIYASQRRIPFGEPVNGFQRTTTVYDWEKKHDLLAKGDPRGPTGFYYVTPPGLIELHELPLWAGLIEVTDRGPGFTFARFSETEVRKAPRLHKEKIKDEVQAHARSVCYYRMHQYLTERNAA